MLIPFVFTLFTIHSVAWASSPVISTFHTLVLRNSAGVVPTAATPIGDLYQPTQPTSVVVSTFVDTYKPGPTVSWNTTQPLEFLLTGRNPTVGPIHT